MRILVLASSLGMGGAERAAANAARILGRKHWVRVLTFHDADDYAAGLACRSLHLPYDIHSPPFRRAARVYQKISGLSRALVSHRPDVVLSFGDAANLINLVQKVLRSDGPVCVTNTQIPPLQQYGGPLGALYLAALRALLPRADMNLALSEGVREQIVRAFGLPEDRTAVVYNALDTDDIARLQAENANRDLVESMIRVPTVVNVGRLMPQKNQALLVRAFRRVRDQVQARLIIVGTGSLEAALRTLVEELGLVGDVEFAGWRANPFDLMKNARVFVLSSDYEGFGNVMAEAMAVGCPVVATSCDFGPSELLQDGRCGILVPVGDEDGLARAMLSVINDNDLHRTLVNRGLQRAQDFSFDVIEPTFDRIFSTSLTIDHGSVGQQPVPSEKFRHAR